MKLKNLIAVLFSFSTISLSYADESDWASVPTYEFTVRRSFPYFFDGAQILQGASEHGIFMNSIGTGYRRKLSGNNFVGITGDFYRYYNCMTLSRIDTGAALQRRFVDFRLDYSRQLHVTELPLLFDAGISFRFGNETLLEGYKDLPNGNHVIYVVSHPMKNFGISTGLTYVYREWKCFRINVQLKYTGYFFNGKKDSAYSYEIKPTSHMISFGFMLGFGR